MAFKLPRLSTNWLTQPQLFQRYWDDVMFQLEKVLNSILDIPLIIDALADLDAATTAAQNAADAANTAASDASTAASDAQAATDAASTEASIVSSYVTGFVGSVLVADSAGDITIEEHTRTYGDPLLNPSVVVLGDTVVSGAVPTDVVRVYYNQSSRAGGAVTYLYTVDPATPPVQSGSTHSVGAVTIPAAGVVGGKWVTSPGYVDI